MTETEWLVCSTSTAMMRIVEAKGSERKLRLFAIACCLPLWDWVSDVPTRHALETAELFCDGLRDREALRTARCAAARPRLHVEIADGMAADAIQGTAYLQRHSLQEVYIWAANAIGRLGMRQQTEEECRQASLLRDIFGPLLFRPVTTKHSWLTSIAVAVARGIYEDRAFDRLPILADALQDACCEEEEILNHCRSEGPHVKGCWVVDLVLGKE